MLTSRHNAQLKRARSLLTRRGRVRERAFLVEGSRALLAVLTAGGEVEQVFAAPGVDEAALAEHGLSPIVVAPELLAELCAVVTPSGLVAVVRSPEAGVDELAPLPPLLLVLDEVRDPGNLGTLLRTAQAVGAAVVLAGDCADPLQPKVVRASAGAVVGVPWARLPLSEAPRWLAAQPHRAVLLDPRGRSLFETDLAWPLALIAGNEAHGPSDEWHRVAQRCRLPMQAGAESLNVAIAAAVALYESVRQHGSGTGGDGAE
ncbi:MAG: RNA methyltransferase [Armatimonadetes bacterium]|nr:RNA methyltransferase [Armatimonadota bacterium]